MLSDKTEALQILNLKINYSNTSAVCLLECVAFERVLFFVEWPGALKPAMELSPDQSCLSSSQEC